MTETGTPSETASIFDLASRLATEAGALLLERRGSAAGSIGTKTSITDLVSDVDRASEALVVRGVQIARPGDAILAEEGSSEGGTSGWRWVIDPLDGTVNYLYNLPAYTVSVAVEYEGRCQVGVVVDPVHDETFAAVRGQGATRNGMAIEASRSNDLALALVGTGFSYDAGRRAQQASVLARLLANVRDIRRAGAASLDLCWVACGRLDGYFERTLAPWDFAAGALIATEAGALAGDLHGRNPSTDFVMAAGPSLFAPLQDLLIEIGAGGDSPAGPEVQSSAKGE